MDALVLGALVAAAAPVAASDRDTTVVFGRSGQVVDVDYAKRHPDVDYAKRHDEQTISESAFVEFQGAMSMIRSRYKAEHDLREEAQKIEEDRRREPPSAGAPPARLPDDLEHGPGFANLPLETKLAIMKADVEAGLARTKRKRAERMQAYREELDRKGRRLDQAIQDIPDVLLRAGEPRELVARFRNEWLLPDPSYHSELRRTYFESDFTEDEALVFLKGDVFAEFKKQRFGVRALPR